MLDKEMFWWQVCCLILGFHFLLGSHVVEPLRAIAHTIGVILATTSVIVLSAHFLDWLFNRTDRGRRGD